MVLLLPLQVCLKRLISFSLVRKQLRRKEVLKLICFFLQILSHLEKLAERQYGVNRDFSDDRADFNLEKRNFSENALCYINQEYAVKRGELAIYNHVFILGQLTVTANQPKDIEMYDCKKNEAKRISCLYDQLTAEVLGLSKQMAYIVLRGDDIECFFSYCFSEKKSSLVFSCKGEFQSHEILNERQHNEEFSSLFYFLH